MKRCLHCLRQRPLRAFAKHPSSVDRRQAWCKDCSARNMRDRLTTNNRTLAMHRYSLMRQRINRVGKHTFGMPLVDRETFLAWCASPAVALRLTQLREDWRSQGCPRRLTPTVDRRDNDKGYELGNMQWLPQYANSSKGNRPVEVSV